MSTQQQQQSGLMVRLKSFYSLLQKWSSPENLVAASISASAVAAISYALQHIVKKIARKLFELFLQDMEVCDRRTPGIYQQCQHLIKVLCIDNSKIKRIRGDDMNKQRAVDEDVLIHDEEKILLKLENGMPPVSVVFVPGVFQACFFYIGNKDNVNNNKHWLKNIKNIICIWKHNDQSFLVQLIPERLRDAIYWVWENTGQALLLSLLGNKYTDFMNSISGATTTTASSSGSPEAFHITTWSGMGELASNFLKEAAHFHKQRMTQSLIMENLSNGLKFKASPRPMSTIAVDEHSDVQELKETVKEFFDGDEYDRLKTQVMPYQHINLLYGPPGNGKTSILQALAIEYGIQFYIMNVKETGTDLEKIKRSLARTLNERCLVIFEDAESLFPKSLNNSNTSTRDEDKNEEGNDGLDEGSKIFSADEFLNLFNGSVESGKPNGRLVFFTTNAKHTLPSKILDLCHRQYAFSNPGIATLKSYWFNFFQDQTKDDVMKSFNTFHENYEEMWLVEDGLLDEHSAGRYRIHCNRTAPTQSLELDNDSTTKKNISYGLNSMKTVEIDQVYKLQLERPVDFWISDPAAWAPGCFWKARIYFQQSRSSSDDTHTTESSIVEEFLICKSINLGETTLFLASEKKEEEEIGETKETAETTETTETAEKMKTSNKSESYQSRTIEHVEILEHCQHSMAVMQQYCIRFRGAPFVACREDSLTMFCRTSAKATPTTTTLVPRTERRNLRMKSDWVASKVMIPRTAPKISRLRSHEVASKMSNIKVVESTTTARKEARNMINDVEKEVLSKYSGETETFVQHKVQQIVRQKLQQMNALFVVRPYRTERIRGYATLILGGFFWSMATLNNILKF